MFERGQYLTNGNAKEFYDEVLAVGGCKVFGWMKEEFPYIQIMHSIRRFVDIHAGRQAMGNKPLGLLGIVITLGTPH